MRRTERKLGSAILLFFVAPFVAEYLLGDLPLRLLPVVIVLAPMYGGGAVLIREIARRHGRGWPTMLLLGAAYAVIEEGFVTQSLFNPDYLFLHGHFLSPAHIAWLGTGGWWTVLMLNLHAFWSIGTSIALVEALQPETSTIPWLGALGDWLVFLVFILGAAANTLIGWKQNHFRAMPRQFAVAGLAVVLLLVLAFAVTGPVKARPNGRSLSPWIAGCIALVFGFAFQMVPPHWGWGAVSIQVGMDLLFLATVALLVRSTAWTVRQTFGLAAGGALAYGLHAFLQPPITGGTRAAALAGHVVFLVIALALIAAGARRTALSQYEARDVQP